MRQTLTAAVGASIVGASLPDGSGAYAVQIDNPSGNWLDVYPGGSPVAPYTQGYVLAFPGEAPSVDVRVTPTGPAGQLSTNAGEAITVTLFSEDEAPDGDQGTPFIEGFTPILSVSMSPFGGDAPTIAPNVMGAQIVGVPNKRIRILTATVAYMVIGLSKAVISDSPFEMYFLDSITNRVVLFYGLSPSKRTESQTFAPGLDLSVGASLNATVQAWWSDVNYTYAITYQLI